MTDNVALPAASGKAATREVTYSGEAAHAQIVGLAVLTGSDDAKTATDVVGISSLSTAPNTDSGILAVGIGPGFDRLRDPSNLGTAVNSTSVIDVAGADTITVAINTNDTGTFRVEVTADGSAWVDAQVITGGWTGFTGQDIQPDTLMVLEVVVSGYRQMRLRTTATLDASLAHKFTAHAGRGLPTGYRTVLGYSALDVYPLGYAEDVELGVLGGGAQGGLSMGRASAAAPTSVSADDDAMSMWLSRFGALNVILRDTSGAYAAPGGGTQYAGDDPATATPTGTMSLGRASAAAPADVSADNDAVALWSLRNGSQVVNLASGGTLVTIGQKAMASSLPVVISSDQSAVPVSGTFWQATQPVSVAAAVAVTDNSGSLTVDAPVGTPVYVRLSDGAANLIGQKAMSASLPVVLASDQSALAVTIAATQAVNISQIAAGTAITGGITGSLALGGPIAHDSPISTINPVVVGAHAMAAAPADVSADNDVVKLWALRNGSLVVNLAAGGTLLTQMGQTAATGNYSRVTDGTTTAGVIVGTTALKTDLSSVAGTATVTGGVAGIQSVAGGIATDSPISTQNPLFMGARASTAVPTAMSGDNDVVPLWANRSGAQVITAAPHVGLNSDPWNLQSKTAQYTTTQTSAVLQAGGASEKIVVTKVQIQAAGTTAGDVQVYFGTGAYSRGTSRAIFDGTFKPSSTLAPGVIMDGPFISGTNGDDVLVTTSAAVNPLTVTIWFYLLT